MKIILKQKFTLIIMLKLKDTFSQEGLMGLKHEMGLAEFRNGAN